MEPVQIEGYEVNPWTMFIKPVKYEGRTCSHIVELEGDFLCPSTPTDIIRRSCEYFGASFEGRQKGSKQLLNAKHKVPIIIDQINSIYFFPTTSPSVSGCIWVSHGHVTEYRSISAKETCVTFQNKQSYIFPISSFSLLNQLQRTALLQTKLEQRSEYRDRKFFYLKNRPGYMEASETKGNYTKNIFF
ncbi:MAG: competence protein ComK [Bacillota bacterium]|nr:competence protein ComK [Bacillota bacterium]MDP4172284.1 competence protein ComK [Bacillota bacterium]